MFYFLRLIVFLFLYIGSSPSCYAYQYENLAYDHRKTPNELDELKSSASEYYEQGDVEKAISTSLELIERCFSLDFEEYIIDVYEYITDYIANQEGIRVERKINDIANYCNTEKRVDLTGVKYSYWAYTYLMEGMEDSAMHYYKASIKFCEDKQMYLVATNLNVNFAYFYYFTNDIKNTLSYTRKAELLAEHKLLPQNIDIPYNLNAIRIIAYRNLGYIEKAIESRLSMVEYLEQDNSVPAASLADSYHSLAVLYSSLGDYDNAVLYHSKCLEIALQYNLDHFYNYYSKLCIISCRQKNGHYKTAEQEYRKLLNTLESIDEKSREIDNIKVTLAQELLSLYLSESRIDSSEYYIQLLEKLHKNTPHKKVYSYTLLVKYNTLNKQYQKAEEYATKAQDLIHTSTKLGVTHQQYLINNYLTINFIKSGEHEKALQTCQAALKNTAPTYSPKTYDNPAFDQVTRKDDLIPTLNNKLKILELLYQQQDPNVTPQLLLSTIKLGIQALEYKNKSFKSKSSQTYWLNKQAIPLFEKAIEIALHIHERTGEQQYLEEAFMLSERSKSMMMMNALQEQNATSFGGIPEDLIEREQELEREFKVIEKLYRDAEMAGDSAEMHYQDSLRFAYHHEKIKLLHRFEADYPKYYELKHKVPKTSIKEVQQALDAATVLIEYFQGRERIYIFTITKEEAFVRSFKRSKVYDVQLISFQNLLRDLERAQQDFPATCRQFIQASSDLHQLLLAKSLVPNKTRLMLIPDGQLAYLPFEVLLTTPLEEAANKQPTLLNFVQLPYLLRQYTINYNYSAQLFLNQRQQRRQYKKLSILGLAPYYNKKQAPAWRNPYEQALRQRLPELEGAVKELDFLSKALQLQGEFLYGLEASEAGFKAHAGNYDILHLAVHGLVDEEKPELSGLALEEDSSRTEDNILYAYEIKQLDLQAQLVVLSACETGVGKYQNGEGVMSIGRGFMYAGVPSLMTTLWNLNDDMGLIIIKKFYENLDAGMAKDEALRHAKLYYLDHMQGTPLTAHPALWACFVQVGDYVPLTIQHNYQHWYWIGAAIVLLLVVTGFLFIKGRKREV